MLEAYSTWQLYLLAATSFSLSSVYVTFRKAVKTARSLDKKTPYVFVSGITFFIAIAILFPMIILGNYNNFSREFILSYIHGAKDID